MLQSPAQPAMVRTKFLSSAAPFGVCTTSGWNCTPYSLRESSAIAANGAPVEMPTARKPGGSLVTRSPWLIHTCARSPSLNTLSNSGVSSIT